MLLIFARTRRTTPRDGQRARMRCAEAPPRLEVNRRFRLSGSACFDRLLIADAKVAAGVRTVMPTKRLDDRQARTHNKGQLLVRDDLRLEIQIADETTRVVFELVSH